MQIVNSLTHQQIKQFKIKYKVFYNGHQCSNSPCSKLIVTVVADIAREEDKNQGMVLGCINSGTD